MCCAIPKRSASPSRRSRSLKSLPRGQKRAGRSGAPLFLRLDQQALALTAAGEVELELSVGFDLVHPPPAVAAEPLERSEAGLVGHARAAIDPIAEVDVG